MASKPISETSSRSSTSSADGPDDTRAHSAFHVIRGAVDAVLGQRRVTEPWIGKASVEIDETLSPQEVSKLETAANRMVSEDAEIIEFEMERAEAEAHFGPRVYDLYSPKEEENLVRVVRIPDWDAAVCPRRHVESTGSIGAIKLEAPRFDAKRKELELGFRLSR